LFTDVSEWGRYFAILASSYAWMYGVDARDMFYAFLGEIKGNAI
jgi:hypothetical protein